MITGTKSFETVAGYTIDPEAYYECHVVKKGRSHKMCVECGKLIPIGQQHTMHKFYGEDGDWPTHATHDMHPEHGDIVERGMRSCTQVFKDKIHKA